MNGSLAQLISLVSYGNNYLKSGELISLYPNNSTFAFCKSVDFRIIRKAYFMSKAKEMVTANDPDGWFKHLKKSGCVKLRLYFEYSKEQKIAKDYKLAGFVGGGGTWLIEAIYPRYSHYWASRWLIGDENEPDKKIWLCNYGLVLDYNRLPAYYYDLTEVKDYLSETLIKISYFAYDNDQDYWGDVFNNALQILSNNNPPFIFYKDMFCSKNHPVSTNQILASASAAYVFGGMGSWNDLGFDTPEKNKTYEGLSERLYDIINKSILATVNS